MTGILNTFIRSWVGVILLAVFASPALASSRVALVIGNSVYDHVPALPNPINDATDIGATLGRLGFAVTQLENVKYENLRQALRTFRREATAAKIAVVYFAGHGIEVDKHNFLVPVDARLETDGDVDYEAVPLDMVTNSVEGASEFGLVLLDACRDNPFRKSMKREKGSTRSIGRGLARPTESGGDTLIVYAAMEGTTASDGKGLNSPFASALLRHMEEPGLEVGIMFRRVSDDVVSSTGRQQKPVWYGSLPSKGAYLYPPTVGIDRERKTPTATQVAALRVEVVGTTAQAAGREDLKEQAARDLQYDREFQDCPQCPQMVVVPAGTFEMGSPSGEGARDEEQRHRVTIPEPIAIGMFEVKRAEFAHFMEETNRSGGSACWQYDGVETKETSGPTDPGFIQGENEPMVCVSWMDAQAYVEWLSRKTKKKYRLLSESEWEYAARGGTVAPRYWDESESGQCGNTNGADMALRTRYTDWFELTALCDDGHAYTSEAGRYGPNEFGLYDMLGNAREWVEDCWYRDYADAPKDGSARTRGDNCSLRVLRGGSWLDGPGGVRSSTRDKGTTGIRFSANGFRVVRAPD